MLSRKVILNLDYSFNWHDLYKYLVYYDGGLKIGLITKGVIYTLKLSIFVLTCSMLIGSIFGIVMATSKGYFKELLHLFVNFMRNIPPIVVMFIFYFFIGNSITKLVNVDWLITQPLFQQITSILLAPEQILIPFISASIGLAIYESAYISEIIRGGINGVDKGQFDAGSALGLTKTQTYTHIVFPQAFEKTLPALLGQFVSIVKNTAIASVVAIPELTFQSMEVLASTRLIIEIWVAILLIYLLINLFITQIAKTTEIRIRKKYR